MILDPRTEGPVEVRLASFPGDLSDIRTLLTEYRAFLGAFMHEARLCGDLPVSELHDVPGDHAPPLGAYILAKVAGNPAGCVAMRPITSALGEPGAELRRLWVRPEFRGHSIGRLLIHAVIDHATRLGLPALYLDTVPAYMPAAQPLYRSFGFVPVPQYGSHSGDGLAWFRLQLPTLTP